MKKRTEEFAYLKMCLRAPSGDSSLGIFVVAPNLHALKYLLRRKIIKSSSRQYGAEKALSEVFIASMMVSCRFTFFICILNKQSTRIISMGKLDKCLHFLLFFYFMKDYVMSGHSIS